MKYVDRLPKSHELYWLEEIVEDRLGLISEEHEAEHKDMMRLWNVDYRNTHPITSTYNHEKKTWELDREYHLKLHVKYWDSVGIHQDVVDSFKLQLGENSIVEIKTPTLPDEA